MGFLEKVDTMWEITPKAGMKSRNTPPGDRRDQRHVLVEHRVHRRRLDRRNVVPKLRSVSSMVIAPASTGSAKQESSRPSTKMTGEERHLERGHARGAPC